jgi:hypothetical protein
VQELFNYPLKVHKLSNLYKEHNISFSKPKLVYFSALKNRDELEVQRKSYALAIKDLISDGKPIIYVDETTFHTWLR